MRKVVLAVASLMVVAACSGSDNSGQGSSSSGASGGTGNGASSSGSTGTGGSSGNGGSSGSSGASSGSSGASGGSSGASSGSSGVPGDGGPAIADAGYDTANFQCGKPGDPGNSLGVGKYCNGFSDCIGNSKAILCATLGDPNAHFCTLQCTQGDNAACGAGASCVCQGGQCGCLPDACK